MRLQSRQGPILIVLLAVAAISAPVAFCADKGAVIKKANDTYYSLKSNGFTEFRCQVLPDWEAIYKDFKMDAIGRDQLIPAVKQTHFSVAVGPTGAVSVSHQSDLAPPGEELASRLRATIGGMDQQLTGFFETWSQFMVNSPLSGSASDYQMEESGKGYRFTADDKDTHAAISMSQDLVIDTVEAKTPEFEGTVHPHFIPHAGGLVLAKYEANSGKGSNLQAMSFEIEYQDIEGLPLPRLLTVTMSLPQGKLNEPIAFADCRVKKR
jgi:hypothetical protein